MTLEIITSDALAPLTHGFFTRKGGASSGIYAGLNCGAGSQDQTELVQINRARVADAMDVGPDKLCGVYQVHSADVHTVQDPVDGPLPKADAIVTSTPGLALSILTADCQPVLFADQSAKVIGAAHAGWKGAKNGVLEATVTAMETLAVIGPSISQRAYEVGPEFLDDFISADSDYGRFFAAGEGDRAMFDLPGFGLHKLREAGVGRAEWTRHCTYSDANRFYSYRRTCHKNEPDYGRLISVIRL